MAQADLPRPGGELFVMSEDIRRLKPDDWQVPVYRALTRADFCDTRGFGWRLLPTEPTPAMAAAFAGVCDPADFAGLYREMLRAVPGWQRDPSVPGWQAVPVEPIHEMHAAFGYHMPFFVAYRDLLDAAPPSPAQEARNTAVATVRRDGVTFVAAGCEVDEDAGRVVLKAAADEVSNENTHAYQLLVCAGVLVVATGDVLAGGRLAYPDTRLFAIQEQDLLSLDVRPGAYYVSADDECWATRAPLAGPFPRHGQALLAVPLVQKLMAASGDDWRSDRGEQRFGPVGTHRADDGTGAPPRGRFNAVIEDSRVASWMTRTRVEREASRLLPVWVKELDAALDAAEAALSKYALHHDAMPLPYERTEAIKAVEAIKERFLAIREPDLPELVKLLGESGQCGKWEPTALELDAGVRAAAAALAVKHCKEWSREHGTASSRWAVQGLTELADKIQHAHVLDVLARDVGDVGPDGFDDEPYAESAPTVIGSDGIAVRRYASSEDAYGACQVGGAHDGDVLVIESEGVVGIADTWPVAVTQTFGGLHGANAAGAFAEFSMATIERAATTARELGLTLGWDVVEGRVCAVEAEALPAPGM
jgi:hypothetical protein